jgi:hypothetical protein
MLAPAGKAFVEAAGFGLTYSYSRFQARPTQVVKAVTGDRDVGIDGGGDHAAQARVNQRLGAGAGAAGVVAGLKGNVGGAAAQSLTGVLLGDFEGCNFGVIPQVVLVPAFASYLSRAIEENAAHGGVGRGDADAAPRQRQGVPHPVLILVCLLSHKSVNREHF